MRQLLAILDQYSQWIGIVGGILIVWLLIRLRPFFQRVQARYAERTLSSKEARRIGTEFYYRNDLIKFVQGHHIASSLFTLDEIAVPPKILSPPPEIEPGGTFPSTDMISRVIPYLADYPELGSYYDYPRLSLPEALSRGANLALLGHPGSGKTFALAYLAMIVSQLSPDAGDVGEYVPLVIHAADLPLPFEEGADLREEIEACIRDYDFLSRRTSSQFSTFLKDIFYEGRALLLLDGVDELTPHGIEQVGLFLEKLLEVYPNIRIVAAVAPEYYGRITRLGLAPVVLAGWGKKERGLFARIWSYQWQKNVQPDIWTQKASTPLDESILNTWLTADPHVLSPLEMTLRAWAIYAGDLLGSENTHSFDSFVHRLASDPKSAYTALERLGHQMLVTMSPIVKRQTAVQWTLGKSQITPEPAGDIEEEEPEVIVEPGRVTRWTLSSLVDSGILTLCRDERIRFSHPVLAGYFASRGVKNLGGLRTVMEQPNWTGKLNTLHYLASQVDISDAISQLSQQRELRRGMLITGRWIRNTVPRSAVRLLIMRQMVQLLQNSKLPLTIRAKALSALTFSGDRSVATLFQKFLTHQDSVVRRLAALGLGVLGEEQYTKNLVELLTDSTVDVRIAACFSLVLIESQQGIETVAAVMLESDPDTQRASAEALALNQKHGYDFLREAVKMDDFLVRRAAVHGLDKVGESWIEEFLSALQLSDDQWVVRSAADEAMKRLKEGSQFVPPAFRSLEHLPWLVSFAAARGETLSDGQKSRDMLYQVFERGDEEQLMAALDFLRRDADPDFYGSIEALIDSRHGEIREAAVNTLWHMQNAGLTEDFLRYVSVVESLESATQDSIPEN